MLEENARVALMIGESLRDQTIQMGLYEIENLLNRCLSEVPERTTSRLTTRRGFIDDSDVVLQVSRGSGGVWEGAS